MPDGKGPGTGSEAPIPRRNGRLPILYLDASIVAIAKPAGWLVHRTSIASDVKQFVVQELRNQLGRHVYPVHRLDRPTAGVLVFALDSASARALVRQFEAREVKKDYLAIVRGFLDGSGTVESPLADTIDPREQEHKRSTAARSARTDFRVLHQVELPIPVGRYQTARYSLLKLRPKTGRRHQLRRHMRRVAHPIIGDRTYGDRDHNAFFGERLGVQQLMLTAWQLTFRHPRNQCELTIRCRFDSIFRDALELIQCPWTSTSALADACLAVDACRSSDDSDCEAENSQDKSSSSV